MENTQAQQLHKNIETKHKRSRVHCQNGILKRLTSLIRLETTFCCLLVLLLLLPLLSLASHNHCFFFALYIFAPLFFFPSSFIHCHGIVFAILQQISWFFRMFGSLLFLQRVQAAPISFICSVFNFRFAFICTFVSWNQNDPSLAFCQHTASLKSTVDIYFSVSAWYFLLLNEPWFLCVAYFACRRMI